MDINNRVNHAHVVEMSKQLKYAPTGILNPNRLKTLDYEQTNTTTETTDNKNSIDSLQKYGEYSPE